MTNRSIAPVTRKALSTDTTPIWVRNAERNAQNLNSVDALLAMGSIRATISRADYAIKLARANAVLSMVNRVCIITGGASDLC